MYYPIAYQELNACLGASTIGINPRSLAQQRDMTNAIQSALTTETGMVYYDGLSIQDVLDRNKPPTFLESLRKEVKDWCGGMLDD